MYSHTSEHPLISVVIAVFNGASSLADTLSSICLQIGVELEIIIIDDGSTDNTPDILQQWALKDQRIKVFRQNNQGLTRALIRGCQLAQGQFIARQDVGDVSLPTRLSKQLALLCQYPSHVLVYCAYDLIGPEDEILIEDCLKGPADDIANSLRDLNPDTLKGPHHGTVMFRKSAYEAVGGYRNAFYFAQDLDLWVRLITVGNVASVPEKLCQLRFSYNSLTALHNHQQSQLRLLIVEAEHKRRQGLSQDQILARARMIVPQPTRYKALARARAAYFIGSILSHRGDSRAHDYWLQAIRANPLHIKAWIKLLRSTWKILS